MPDDGENALSLDSAANEILSILGDDDDDAWSPPTPELEDDDREIERLLGQAASDDGAAEPDADAEADRHLSRPIPIFRQRAHQRTRRVARAANGPAFPRSLADRHDDAGGGVGWPDVRGRR